MTDETEPSDAQDRAMSSSDPAEVALIGGNPHCHRATFTRFLLPFSWSKRRGARFDQSRPHFRRADARDWLRPAHVTDSFDRPYLDKQRRRYLTKETDSLLFENAFWLVLESPGKGSDPWRTLEVASGVDGARYRVALRPPTVVLFEASSPADPGANEPNLLQNGFLIHEAHFPDTAPRFADFLRFNEIFRYWRCPFPDHATFCAGELGSIARGIREISSGEPAGSLYDAAWQDLLSVPMALGPDSVVELVTEPDGRTLMPPWVVNPDDRAFTMPFAVLRASPPHASTGAIFASFVPGKPIDPCTAGYWTKLLNVDRPFDLSDLGCASEFEIKWAKKRTYKRWTHAGTLYGFCEHAFAALAIEAREDGELAHGEPPLGLHFATMYLDVTLLLFYLRVSVLRFSQRLHEVTRASLEQEGRQREVRRWRESFHQIRWQFLLLENLYQYPHLSNQQQHLEMYALQRESMDVRELYAEIDKEVRASDEFLSNELDQERNELDEQRKRLDEQRNRLVVSLNVVAVFGLAAALALGWMDAHSATQSGPLYFAALFIMSFVALITLTLVSPWASGVMTWITNLSTAGRAVALLAAGVAMVLSAWGLPRMLDLDPWTPNPPAVGHPQQPATATEREGGESE